MKQYVWRRLRPKKCIDCLAKGHYQQYSAGCYWCKACAEKRGMQFGKPETIRFALSWYWRRLTGKIVKTTQGWLFR